VSVNLREDLSTFCCCRRHKIATKRRLLEWNVIRLLL